MSIEGLCVLWNGRFASYSPCDRNCVSTSFSLEAQISLPTGRPMRFAYQPARMSPKLPVGTQKSTVSPMRISSFSTILQYA